MKHTMLAILALVFVSSLAPNACAEEVQGKVKEITGSVELIVDGQSRPLLTGESVPVGAIIKTGPASTVTFSTVPGSWIFLDENTSFKVEELDVVKVSDTDSKKRASFSLDLNKSGRLVAAVRENPHNAATLNIQFTYQNNVFQLEAEEGTVIELSQKGIGVVSGAIILRLRDGRVWRLEDGFFFNFSSFDITVWQFLGLTAGQLEGEGLGGSNGAIQNIPENPSPSPSPGQSPTPPEDNNGNPSPSPSPTVSNDKMEIEYRDD